MKALRTIKAVVITAAVAFAMALGATANAQSITTLFAWNNQGSAGGAVYFDITIGPSDLAFTAFDMNLFQTGQPGQPFTMDVYVTVPGGTFDGNETNAAAWMLVGSASGTAMGSNVPSLAEIGMPFTLAAGTTYGMMLVLDGSTQHRYTNGNGVNQNYANADLALALGSATNVPWTPQTFKPRVWNGTIYYDVIPLDASVAIKPGSCPNPLNRQSRGNIPVSLLGTEQFDVTNVEVSSLLVSRADGIGGFVAPLMGPPGPGISYEDVATPFAGSLNECGNEGLDGSIDLNMKFDTTELVDALELGDFLVDSPFDLCVSGLLLNGTLFSGCDSVIISR